MKTLARSLPVTVPALLVLTLSAPAHAYVGPGAGLGVIGTLVGIVAAIVLAMFGLLWYPLKRAFGKKGAADGAPVADGATGDAATASTVARTDAASDVGAGHPEKADPHGDAAR